MNTFEINGWTVDERGVVIDGTFEEKPPLGPSPRYAAIEGVLLPRNPDGSLQFDEHTSIAPEAAEGLLQRLQEARAASQKVVNLCTAWAPIEQIVKADAVASDAWLRYEGDKRRAAERIAEDVKAKLDMLQEGCPHHDPVD
jgi:hypothetical protein